MSGPTRATRALVWRRDNDTCQWCGAGLYEGSVTSLQHRRPRGMGGTRKTDANLPGNLILVCGTGTTGCHGHMESDRLDALDRGFLVKQAATPVLVPVVDWAGRAWLYDNDGGREETWPPNDKTPY